MSGYELFFLFDRDRKKNGFLPVTCMATLMKNKK